jgi:hypothetical protein
MKRNIIKPRTKIYKNINDMFKTWTKERKIKVSDNKPRIKK